MKLEIDYKKKQTLVTWALVAAGIIALAIASYGLLGLDDARGESQYTGTVVDVVEDRGTIFRPTWVNMKTDPRSSDVQQFCITPDDENTLIQPFYDAMERGDRVTITYSRPLWVSPQDCGDGQSIIHGVRAATGG